ncbi:hypothetical protein [Novosphingobium sp. MMS21-SN21R]|uniref:hypothetical protein n=1 Tax=Novosphingobium sp. MMS21-SN21R TaxID=2969298 RepID=UPI0028851D40|nr:hypothetical protein [Novosphingobium sp. MMS21-SN21R]MDT0508366.1 hypothetical protein [Novosphingobium sp. MMS21-SN21R]
MKFGSFWVAASAVAAVALAPSAALAGTRASTTNVTLPAASGAQGPKGGFPNSPGLVIANIKANSNAAFKRPKSNGT